MRSPANRLVGAIFLLLCCALPAHAQSGARYDTTVISPSGVPVAGAYVRVCSQPASGTPCSPTASIYSDVNLTMPAPNPETTDQFGNAYFYVAAGKYTVEFYGMGLTDKQLPDQTITLPLTATPTFTTIYVTNGVVLYGSTSGQVTLLAPSVAGTNTATFPAATGNVLLDTATQSISGKTLAQNILADVAGARTVGSAADPYASIFLGGAATNNIDLTGTATASRTATLPDNTGTIAELNLAQSWSATQTFPSASLTPGEISPGTNGQCVITSGGVAAWGTCTSTVGANTALSNLASVSINTTLLPGSAGSVALGSEPLPFTDLFLGSNPSQALDFNTLSLTTDRTLTIPDNSGPIAELNFAQTWPATQTFTNPIISSVTTGTAPFSIASTTLVPNLNVGTWGGVTISGTPSAGQVPVASSSAAASWGTVNPVSVKLLCSAAVISNVAISSAGGNVTSVLCTMPSSGCPCRAFISYSLYLTFSASEKAIAFWVSDGTNIMAGVQTGTSNASAGGGTSATYSGFSQVTYSNSAGITFTVEGQDSASTGTVLAAPTVGSGPNSGIQVAIFTSD